MKQINSIEKLKQGTKIELDSKVYEVQSCIDRNWLDQSQGYTLVLKYLYEVVKSE